MTPDELRAAARARAGAGDGPRTKRVRARLAELRAEVPDVVAAVPAGVGPACASCVDHCCKAPHQVSLRMIDVAVLLDAGLGFAIAPPPSSARLPIAPTPIAGSASASHMPVLRQDERGDCVFLDADRRCTIHSIRPLTCRRFPYFIDDERTMRWASSCAPTRAASEEETAELAAAALESWSSKPAERALLEEGEGALRALGLDPELYAKAGGEAFADVLARYRATKP